jgi:precorrin-8X/cobalt-precorrin-8 methylmutase
VRHFERVVFVDWSAAASRGPKRPSPDRCWVAWGGADERPKPRYFPYGFPHASGLGGGRDIASRLAARIADTPDGTNNRFEVAAQLNRELNAGRAGPFWGCPKSEETATLTAKAPPPRWEEYRIVEKRLRQRGRQVQSVWKLFYRASVGSQTLTGLAAVHRLLIDAALSSRSRVWPFETGWDADLSGIIHAEIWPTLKNSDGQPFGIKDARQVAELRDWALDEDARGALRRRFARPAGLSETEEKICRESEGWILGVE